MSSFFASIITVIWVIVVIRLSGGIYGSRINECSITNFVWCVLALFSSYGLFEFYIPHERTYFYVFIFLFTFTTTSFLIQTAKGVYRDDEIFFYENDVHIPTLFFFVFFFFIVVYFIPEMKYSLNMYLSGNLLGVHNSILKGPYGYMGWMKYYVYSYVFKPIGIVLFIETTYAIFSGHNKRRYLLILSIIWALVITLLGGGRKAFFDLFSFFLIGFLVFLRENRNSTRVKEIGKLKWKIILPTFAVGFASIIGMVSVTNMRRYFGFGIIETLWHYFVGPFVYLDNIIQNPSSFGIGNDRYLFGQGVLGFVFVPIYVFLSAVFGLDYNGPDYAISMYTEKFYSISPVAVTNASTTLIYPFIRDFGYFGVILSTIVLSMIVAFVHIRSISSSNHILWRSMYIFALYTMYFSIWRYTPLVPEGAMTVLFLLLFHIIPIKLTIGGKVIW